MQFGVHLSAPAAAVALVAFTACIADRMLPAMAECSLVQFISSAVLLFQQQWSCRDCSSNRYLCLYKSGLSSRLITFVLATILLSVYSGNLPLHTVLCRIGA